MGSTSPVKIKNASSKRFDVNILKQRKTFNSKEFSFKYRYFNIIEDGTRY